jgi:hypothetical protein
MTDCHQFGCRAFNVGDLGIIEKRSVENRATPIDHPDQQTAGVFREALETSDKGAVFFLKDRPVRPLYEAEHLREVIEIVEGGQNGQLHGALFLGRNQGMFYFCSKKASKVKPGQLWPVTRRAATLIASWAVHLHVPRMRAP